MRHFKITFPYLLFVAMVGLVIWSNVHERSPSAMTYAESVSTMASLEDMPFAESVPADPTVCQHCGMRITEDSLVADKHGGSTVRFCCEHCKEAYLENRLSRLTGEESSRTVDPVCHMEVNPTWGINYEYEGVTFFFCTEMCRKAFAADPLVFLVERCMVCRKPVMPASSLPATYLGQTYYLCSAIHRQDFLDDPAKYFMHRMWGIPSWLYYVSIALVLVVSFFMFEGASLFSKRERNTSNSYGQDNPRPERINILRVPFLMKALRSRRFRFVMQLLMVAIFLLIIGAGLFGNQNPALNVAPILTWTIWWCGLIVLIMFAGKFWCYVCPWDAIAFWLARLRLWKKTDNNLGLGLPWPRLIRNIALATLLFVLLTWIELGFNVTMRPKYTAYIAIGMLMMAIVSAFLFERQSFCRYGCLVGRVSGLYALFSGIELRHKSLEVCSSCTGKECYRGSSAAYGCPTFEFPAKMTKNTYCIQCSECLQSCPHDNLAVNLRPWGEDLRVVSQPRTDEAYLALLMLAISGFHGLTMTPVWADLTGFLESALSVGRIGAFSLGMALILGLPITIYGLLVWLSGLVTRGSATEVLKGLSYHDYFVRYAYCLLPIALFYHLAHNLEHLLMEGPKILSRISDPFGWGWNLFKTAGVSIPPLTSLDVLWVLQIILVGVGHIYSLWVAQKISRQVFPSTTLARRGQWPMLAAMIIFSIFSLWLLKQPMEMRTSAM